MSIANYLAQQAAESKAQNAAANDITLFFALTTESQDELADDTYLMASVKFNSSQLEGLKHLMAANEYLEGENRTSYTPGSFQSYKDGNPVASANKEIHVSWSGSIHASCEDFDSELIQASDGSIGIDELEKTFWYLEEAELGDASVLVVESGSYLINPKCPIEVRAKVIEIGTSFGRDDFMSALEYALQNDFGIAGVEEVISPV